jgi:hypothetical protein
MDSAVAASDIQPRSSPLSYDQPLYQSLDSERFQIRYLSLNPGQFHERITASMKVAFLDKSPQYVALSYVWGHDQAPSPILIGNTSMHIKQNLDTALRHLRDLVTTRALWVDAICINQEDRKEKADQVKQMGLIYFKAQKVMVWLGSADESFEPVETFLRDLDEQRARLRSSAIELKVPYPGRSKTHHDPEFSLALRDQKRPTSVLRGLLQLFSRPYWERVWIIQEISKASKVEVMFGRLRVHWNPLLLASRNLKDLPERTRTLLSAITNFRAQEQRYGGFSPNSRMSLFDALIMSRYSLATDPRDKIYALLGMTCDGSNLVPLPTYGAASELPTVFHDLTNAIIKSQQPSNILLLSNWVPARERFRDATRWCIDWTDLSYHLPPWLTKVKRPKPPIMTKSCLSEFDGNELITRGICVGRLQTVEGTTKSVSLASPKDAVLDEFIHTPLAVEILKQLTSDLRSRLSTASRSTVSCGDTDIVDALARMIRDVNKGMASANYDMQRVEDILDHLGKLQYGENPIWEWARQYNAFRNNEEYKRDNDFTSTTQSVSIIPSPPSPEAGARLASPREDRNLPPPSAREQRKDTWANVLKRPNQAQLQPPSSGRDRQRKESCTSSVAQISTQDLARYSRPASNASSRLLLSPRPPLPSMAAFQIWEDILSVLDATPEYKLRFASANLIAQGEHLVLVCKDAKPDDLIYQIEHSDLPVILRKNQNRFDFIGDVCVGRQDTGEWNSVTFADDDPFTREHFNNEMLHISLEGTFSLLKASYDSLYSD